MVIMLGQKKGGVYKSMTALNLAGVAAQRGHRVCMVDADTNETVNNFLRRRNARNENVAENLRAPFIKSELKRPDDSLARDLQDLDKHYDYVIVDTGGYENNAFKTGLQVADIVYLPYQPCTVDIEQLAPTVKVIKETEDFIQCHYDNFSIDARLLVTGVDQHSNDLMLEARTISEKLLPWCSISSAVIKTVKAVRTGQDEGLTLADLRHSKRAMYEMLLDEIDGKRRVFCERVKLAS